jgi:hypothetical protein
MFERELYDRGASARKFVSGDSILINQPGCWQRLLSRGFRLQTYPTSKDTKFSRYAAPASKGHLPIFTHGDLQRKNIMVQKLAATGCAKEAEEG